MTTARDFWLAIVRGVLGQCPRCGDGKLLQSYLKPVEKCSACGEQYGHIRADDGPAWLTIVIVGHILGVILLAVMPHSDLPTWTLLVSMPLLALVIALLVLPRAKGFFIALIWQKGSAGC